jgi:hexokinase
MEMLENGDGVPLTLSKELDVPEAVGKPIGEGLRAALARQGVKTPQRIALLNDTTATLLSGIATIPRRYADKTRDDSQAQPMGEDKIGCGAGPVIGFILGTGFNTAHSETEIPKINFHSKDRPQIVVAESGCFTNPLRGELDIEFDNTTKNPNSYTTEKAAAGAYLGPLMLHILKRAVHDKALLFKNKSLLLEMRNLETRHLNEFLNNPLALSGPLGSLFQTDELDAIKTILYLASIVSERAALLSAAILAGTIELICAGFEPQAPVRIAVEGTTYMRFYRIREALEARLHTLLSRNTPRHYIISPVSNASLYGAAVAAL